MFTRKRLSTYVFTAMLIVLMVVGSAPGLLAAGTSTSGTLNIQQAIDWAYASDPTVKRAEMDVQVASLQRDKLALQNYYFVPNGPVTSTEQGIIKSYQQAEITLKTAQKAQKIQKDAISDSIITKYIAVIKAKDSVDLSQLTLITLQKQKAVRKISKDVGMLSQFDWDTMERGIAQAEEGLKAAQANYITTCTALNEAIGKNKSDNYEMLSTPIADTVLRDALDKETTSAIENSSAVWVAEQNVKNQEIAQQWVQPTVPSDIAAVQWDQAKMDEQKAKRDARTTVETAFFGLDALEKQIAADKIALATAQNNLRIAEVKYNIGTLPLISPAVGSADLMTSRVDYEKAKITLEQHRCDLIKTKADFYLLTGRTAFDSHDWSNAGLEKRDFSNLDLRPSGGYRVTFTLGLRSYNVDGSSKTMDAAPYLKNGRTYVPVGYLARALGAASSWDTETRKATLTRGTTTVILAVGDSTICVNGKYTNMDTAPEMINGRLMLPARYVVDAFGGRTTWDDKTRQIVIYK
ncbi:MAG: stalk domain-containing protein [Candidatus Saccharibacteria bacterium]